jgi:hypothetical protein
MKQAGGQARPYPTNFRAGDVESARDVARRNRQLGNIRAEWPLVCQPRDDSIVLKYCGTATVSTWDLFGYTLRAGGILKIRKRTIFIHQIAKASVAETNILLTGSTAVVYVRMNRATSYTGTIEVATEAPLSDARWLFVTLYTFTLKTTTGVYVLDDPHSFDVNIDSPSR